MSGPAVVIPVLDGATYLRRQLPALRRQTLAPAEILVIDSSSADDGVAVAREHGARVEVIERRDFNHGGTRNLGVALTRADPVVFLTQDALPADERFLAELARPLREGEADAAFARQIPYPGARPLEVFARLHNYPGRDELRDRTDLEGGNVRAVFFSNVASAVDRAAFAAVGGFPGRVIMNEDMVLCAKLLRDGRRVAYRAEARVFHSHDYTLAEQFRRYFDIGVFFSRHRDLLPTAEPGGEGLRYLRRACRWLLARGAWDQLPWLAMETAAKYLGFRLGRAEAHLASATKRRLAMHRGFFAAGAAR